MIAKKTEWYLCGILALGALGSFFVAHGPAFADGLLHVYFLNIGQGDSMLVRAPDGTQILIDGGPGKMILAELAEILPINDNSIDVIVATHPEADHITGLVEVLDKYEVSRVIETGVNCVTAVCAKWNEAVSREEAQRELVSRGSRVLLGDKILIEIISPPAGIADQRLSKPNNGGIVMRLTYMNQSILFTADVEKSVEDEILRADLYINSDFLKVGHHGSKTSTSEAFLSAVTPLAAFIQAGANNRYGHPSAEVLNRLEKVPGLRYYRNDVNGRIELILDGTNYAIKTES